MHNKTETFNRELEFREKNQIKFLIWKNIKSEIKNSEDWFNTRLDIAKERISKLKDK